MTLVLDCDEFGSILSNCRPRSEASKGYIFTGVCHFNSGGGGGWPVHNTSLPPPGTWLQHPPPSPPGTWSQHPPPSPPHLGHGHNTHSLPPPPPRDMVTTPAPSPPTWDMVTTPAPLPLPTWDMVTTPTPLPTWDMVTTPPPPPHLDYVQAGGTHPTGMHSCLIILSRAGQK